MPISFDTTGFRQLDQTTWQHGNGDHVVLEYYGLVPDLPAGLDDLPKLRHDLATLHAEDGCLIEAHVVQLAGVPALLRIIKMPLPNRPAGQGFLCSFTVPKATCSAVLQLIAPEGPVSGMREAALVPEVGFDRWVMPHPYAPQLQGKLPFHAGDDPRFDSRFPDHPLSRARAWAHHVVRTARLDPQFAALPPFQPKAPAPDVPPEVAAIFNSQLTTAICGIPVAGYLALQIGERTTYWKTLDDALPRRLARGTLGRSPMSQGRFREMVMVDEQSGHALMMDRFMTDGATLGIQLGLRQVSRDEAYAAATPEALREAYRWVGRMIEVADGRNEYLTVEPITHQGERADPFAMLAVQNHEGQDIVLVSCSPRPSESSTFQGSNSINAPVSRETAQGIGELAMAAVLEWGPHPLDMAVTFNRYGGTIEAQGTPESVTDEVRAQFSGQLVTAVPGMAVGGYVALQVGEQRSYWRLPGTLLSDRLGFGALARNHSPGHRFRDVVLIDQHSGELLIPSRYSEDGATLGTKSALVRVSPEEAMAAATPEACHESFQRLGRSVYMAAKRGELIFVERLENELRQDPYVFLGVQNFYDDNPIAVASATPAPSANTQFNGKPTLEGPGEPGTIVGLGLLALQAINDWGIHPLHVVPTYHRPTR